MKPLRILVADDHYAVRHGLRALLEAQPGVEICGEATDGLEAITLAKKLKPSVILMDINLPVLNGLESMRRIRQELPETRMLVFSIHDSPHMVREAVKAGAQGYVLKAGPEEDLTAALEAVCQGKRFFSSTLPQEFVRKLIEED